MERDRFLRVLERDWERERDRRDLLERLGERFPVSAVGAGGGGSVSVATGNGVKREREREGNNNGALQTVVPGSIAAAMVDWASRTLLITLSSSLAAACGVISGGFTMALFE